MTIEELSKTVFDLQTRVTQLEKIVATILAGETRQLETMNAFMEALATANKAKEKTDGPVQFWSKEKAC